ncbi:CaiB/baiF CoA-transferase family protein [Fusarium oxysporum f. sp. albedinis]|nr:CaiB/baiF CoA-transferase family protein [Fusarium oxysporum f. sp. albedinis]
MHACNCANARCSKQFLCEPLTNDAATTRYTTTICRFPRSSTRRYTLLFPEALPTSDGDKQKLSIECRVPCCLLLLEYPILPPTTNALTTLNWDNTARFNNRDRSTKSASSFKGTTAPCLSQRQRRARTLA